MGSPVAQIQYAQNHEVQICRSLQDRPLLSQCLQTHHPSKFLSTIAETNPATLYFDLRKCLQKRYLQDLSRSSAVLGYLTAFILLISLIVSAWKFVAIAIRGNKSLRRSSICVALLVR